MKRAMLAAAVICALANFHAWADSDPVSATTLNVTKVTVKAHDPKDANLGYDIEVTGTMSLDPAAKSIALYSFYFKDSDKKDVIATIHLPVHPKPGQTVEWKVKQFPKPVLPQKGWIIHADITDDLGLKKPVEEPIPAPPA